MRFLRYPLACGLAALVLLNSVPVVRACGPIVTEPIFVLKESPDPPFGDFTNGKIGILRPTFGRKTMVIAYRYFNGGSFTAEEQKALVDALKGKAPEEDGSKALEEWLDARKEFLKEDAEKLPKIYRERPYGGYDYFPNCAKNAFEVAIETLKDRAATYGAEDPNVRAWLAAQDTVFQNCGASAQIPAELGAESPTWLRKDREYQIGAAYFYLLNFDEARARFAKIAADSDSPWREVADYLVARTLIRQGSLAGDEKKKRELYERAETHLQSLVVSGNKYAGASKSLLGLVKYHLHPEERVVELSRVLAAGSDDNMRQDLIDYVWLLDRFESRILTAEEERKKKLEGTVETKTLYEDRRPEAKQRGETIQITIYPVTKPDGNKDYAQAVGLEFKYDVSEAEILSSFEQQIGRKLSVEEIKQIKEQQQSALGHREWNVSPNRKWDSGVPSRYEGCRWDCTRLTFDLIPDFLRSDDLTDWILTMQTEDPSAYRHAFAKWRETDSPAWLVTALMKATTSSARLPELMRAGQRVGRNETAFLSIAYHLIRLKTDLGNRIEARRLLDEIISWQSDLLPVSAQNQFLELRMQLSRSLSEFLKSAQRRPVAFYHEGMVGKLGDLFERLKAAFDDDYTEQTQEEYERDLEKYYKDLLPWDDRFEFDQKTIDIFNWHFPLQSLAEAARNPNLPDYLQRSLVLVVWTRAILLNNHEVALSIAPEVLRLEPKLTSVFEPYLKARTVKQRREAALYVLLNFPNLSPFVQGGLPAFSSSEELDYHFEEAWWCKPSVTEYNERGDEVKKVVARPSFLTPAQLDAAQREHFALAETGEGKSYLGRQVIAWSKTSPNDARIPEALFIAARANERYKYGCNGWDSDEKSKNELESILRRRYPLNPWTTKLADPEN